MNKAKLIYQKGISIIEAMTAASVLGLAVTIFLTLQATQEKDFAVLRSFDKAAYAVELMFEELAAVYNPVAVQYGSPSVFEDTTAGLTLKVKGFEQLPGNNDEFTISGVGGKYKITANTGFDTDQNTVLTIERSDVPEDTLNKNMAADASQNADITLITNAAGSLEPYHELDMTRFEDTVYINTKPLKVRTDLVNWGTLLQKHLGASRTGDVRSIEVDEVTRQVPVDANNDGVTDQVDGEDVTESVKKKQVTIFITQDTISEQFRRLFLAGL